MGNGAAAVQLSENSQETSSEVHARPHAVGQLHESHPNMETSDGFLHVVSILNHSLREQPTPQGAVSTKARPQEAVNVVEAAPAWGSVVALFKHSLRTQDTSNQGMEHVKAIFQHSLRHPANESSKGMADVKAIFEHSLRPEVKERLQQESKGMADVKAIFEHSLRPQVE